MLIKEYKGIQIFETNKHTWLAKIDGKPREFNSLPAAMKAIDEASK